MHQTKKTLQELDFIATNLRVPDIRYQDLEQARADIAVSEFCQSLMSDITEPDLSLMAFRQSNFPDKALPGKFLNLLFILDRVFDVWWRKNSLDEALYEEINLWRRVLLRFVVASDQSSLASIEDFLDKAGSSLRGWCENPERVKRQVPDLLQSLYQMLAADLKPEKVVQALKHYEAFWNATSERFDKVTERLIHSEENRVSQHYFEHFAANWINQIFRNRKLPPKVQSLVSTEWLALIATKARLNGETGLDDKLVEVTKKIRAVFCDQGRAAFRFGDSLIDEMIEQFDSAGLSFDAQLSDELNQLLIAILKSEPPDTELFKPLSVSSDQASSDRPGKLIEGDWYLDTSNSVRLNLIKHYVQEAQVLFVNYLGMRLELCTEAEMSERISSRLITKLPPVHSFSEAISVSLRSLKKVAATQVKERERAAQKAFEEAQKLQIEREQAELEIKRKAEEIAAQSARLAEKQAHARKQKLEDEALSKILALSLGAWIALEQEGERLRYKLAVKFAAKKRYIFVDKHGVKKVEFDEAGLVTAIVSGDLEILSDGADFDDSLERVIGRMRMSR